MSLETWTFQIDPPTNTLPIGEKTYREGRYSGPATFGDSLTATRIFLVDWDQHEDFVSDLIGYAEPPVSLGGNLIRTLPEAHCDYDYIYATDVSVKPGGVGETVAPNKSKWKTAEITTTFKPLPFGVYADADIEQEYERFVSVDTDSKAESLQVNNVGMQFVSRTTNKSVQVSPSKPVPSITKAYTWWHLPAPASTDDDPLGEYRPPNLSLYTRLIGMTNYTTFDMNPPRTMILLAVTPQRLDPATSNGLYRYNLTYTFEVRNHGADNAVGSDAVAGVDYIFDLANDRWDLITTTGTTSGKRLFQAADFRDLFRWGIA